MKIKRKILRCSDLEFYPTDVGSRVGSKECGVWRTGWPQEGVRLAPGRGVGWLQDRVWVGSRKECGLAR